MADNEKQKTVSENHKTPKGDERRFEAIRDGIPSHLRPQNVPRPIINLSTPLNERLDYIFRKVEKKELSEPIAAEVFAHELRNCFGQGVASFVRQPFIRVSGDYKYAYVVGPNDFSTTDSDEAGAAKLLLFVLSNAAGGNRALGVYRSCNVKLDPLTSDEVHYSRLPEEIKIEYDNGPIPCTALVFDAFDDEKRSQVQQATIVLPAKETPELAKSSKTELIRTMQPLSLQPPLPSTSTPSFASGSEEGIHQAEPNGEINPERAAEIQATSSQSARNNITIMTDSASSQARPGQERPEETTVTPSNGVGSLCDQRLATEDTTAASSNPKKIVQQQQKTTPRSSHNDKGKARAVDVEHEHQSEELDSGQGVKKSRRPSKHMEWPSRRTVGEEGPGDESSDVTDHSVDDGEEESGDEEEVNPTITDNGPVTPATREKRKRKAPSSGESEKRNTKQSRLVLGAAQSSPSSSRRPFHRHQSSSRPTALGQAQLDTQKAIERRRSEPSLRHQQHGAQSEDASAAKHSQSLRAAETFRRTESDRTVDTFTQSSRAMSANHLLNISTIGAPGANVQYEPAQGCSVPSRGAEGRRSVDFMFGPSVPTTSENFEHPQRYLFPRDTIVRRPWEIILPRPENVEQRAGQPVSSTGTTLSRDATGLLQGWHAILMNIDEAILAEGGIRITQPRNNEITGTPQILPPNPEDSLLSLLNVLETCRGVLSTLPREALAEVGIEIVRHQRRTTTSLNRGNIAGGTVLAGGSGLVPPRTDRDSNDPAVLSSSAPDRSSRAGQDRPNGDTPSRRTQQGERNTQHSRPAPSSRSTMREALGNQQQVLGNGNEAPSHGQRTTNDKRRDTVNSAFNEKELSPMEWAPFSEEEVVDDRGSPIEVDFEVASTGASRQNRNSQRDNTSHQAPPHQMGSEKSMKQEEDLGRTGSPRDNVRGAGSTSQLSLSSNNVAANRGGSSQQGSSKRQAPAQGGDKSKPAKPGKALPSSASENIQLRSQKGRGNPSSGSEVGALPSNSGDRKGKKPERSSISTDKATTAGDSSETPQVAHGDQESAPRCSAGKTSASDLPADSQSSSIEAKNTEESKTNNTPQERASGVLQEPVSEAARMNTSPRPGDETFSNMTQTLDDLSLMHKDRMDTSEN